jgi:predicted nucleic acid-binding Zn ribbon protein
MRSLSDLMGETLGQVARQTGGMMPLHLVWSGAVGDVVSKHTRPVQFSGDTLVVRCDGMAWRDALASQEAELLHRLKRALNAPRLSTLAFTLG